MSKSIKVNAILNAIRQSLSIIFPLITFPYVSRVLGSVEYGRYTFSTSFVSYFALLAAFGISNFAIREAAAIRNDKYKVTQFASRLFSFNIITLTLSYCILFLLIVFNSKLNNYSTLILIHSLCMIFTTLGMDWINNVFEDFLYITVRYIVIQILAIVAIFLFVKSPADTSRYCLITVLASYGGNLINLVYIRKYVKIKLLFDKELFSFIKPLLILFLNSFAVIIYVNSDITLLGLFLDDYNVGIYSFSSKIYNMVKYFINALIVVVIPRLSYYYNNGEKGKYTYYVNSLLSVLVMITLPITSALLLLSKSIIMIAGGTEYLPGNLSLRILCFAIVFAIIASVFTNCILIISRNETICLRATFISAIVNIILNTLFIPLFGIVGAALTTVIAEIINLMVQAYYSNKLKLIKTHISKQTAFASLVGTAITVGACCLLNSIIIDISLLSSIIIVLVAMILSISIYTLFLWFTHNQVFIQLLPSKLKPKSVNNR